MTVPPRGRRAGCPRGRTKERALGGNARAPARVVTAETRRPASVGAAAPATRRRRTPARHLTFCQSRSNGGGGCAPLPPQRHPSRQEGTARARALRHWEQNNPPPPTSIPYSWGRCPHFPETDHRGSRKATPSSGPTAVLGGLGRPSRAPKRKAPGGPGARAPSSRPRKGWRGHGCKVLGFFSLCDMNTGIRTASFRRSLRRTKGPAVRAAQPLIKRQSPVTQHHPRYLCS